VSTRTVRVFRYDPATGGDGHFDQFILDIPDETTATMLDVLLRIQREQDPTIAFRFACRVTMCGSCGMVINGKEALACKTNVADIKPGQDITLRPLNHYPLIKDLVVDLEPLFQKFDQTLQFFEPKEEFAEPAILPPDAPERPEMRIATDCIACGCCVSSCTMCHYHEEYAGPAVLNRAYSLLADSRDALFEPRLERALETCYQCRTEINCTEVCPKDISSTRAIKYIQRLALTHRRTAKAPAESAGPVTAPAGTAPVSLLDQLKAAMQMDRATFLRRTGVGLLGAGCALVLGGIGAATALGPAREKILKRWIPVAQLSEVPKGQITTVLMKYELKSGIYAQPVTTPVLISRLGAEIICYKTSCPHLGCLVHWDGQSDQFRCACHGGTFDRNGKVLAGPPPRALDRYPTKIVNEQLLIEVT
jgi:succinate dehydrogenase / fumarate reductase, iron-sulfur subunit